MDELMRLPAVAKMFGVAPGTIYRWMRAGHFPRCVRISPGSTGWRRSDVQAHLAALAEGPSPARTAAATEARRRASSSTSTRKSKRTG